MNPIHLRFIGLTALLLSSPPLAAQEKADAAVVSALAAAYQLANADGDRTCALTLKADALKPEAGVQNYAVAFDKAACVEAIPFTGGLAGWTPGPGDSIRLMGTQGRLIAEFTEGVGGTWEALREGDGVYFLTNPAIGDPTDQAQPADMVGEWNVARAADGKPVCLFSLTDAPAPDGSFRLELRPGCDASIVRFAPDRWRLERGDLVVVAANGDTLRFAGQDEGGWAKVPAGSRPLFLSRP